MSKEQELYLSIVNATKNGNDAEVKRDRDGNFQVYSVKKKKEKSVLVSMVK